MTTNRVLLTLGPEVKEKKKELESEKERETWNLQEEALKMFKEELEQEIKSKQDTETQWSYEQ